MLPRHLQKMIGRRYMYMAHEHTIKDIRPGKDPDLFVVLTDENKTITVTLHDLRKDFLPSGPKRDGIQVYQQINASMPLDSLARTLEENIQKILADPKHIPQAKAVNETARELINLRKLQVDVLRIAQSITKG